MKFVYEYRTSDNVRHQGTVSAASREAAFAALRAQGIRPGRMTEASGVLNILFGKGKRWIVIGILLVVVLVLAVLVGRDREIIASHSEAMRQVRCTPRHQIYGDPVTLKKWAQGGLTNVFANLGDCVLASFAQPAKAYPISFAKGNELGRLLRDAIDQDLEISEKEMREVRELKQIVNGMKEELRLYLSTGVGTVDTYARRLRERDADERLILERTRRELVNERDETVWEAKNARLRRIGLPPIEDFETEEKK